MRLLRSPGFLGVAVVAATICSIDTPQARRGPGGWPQLRGPGGSGVLDGAPLPLKWSATQGVAWSVEVPGRGWSSPVVWNDQVFVTSAISPGAFKQPSPASTGR